MGDNTGCNSCIYLQENKKIDGKLTGAVYFCSKNKKFVSGADNSCDTYKVDPLRKTSLRDEIYRNGKKYANDNTEPGTYLTILIIVIIIGIIITIFN